MAARNTNAGLSLEVLRPDLSRTWSEARTLYVDPALLLPSSYVQFGPVAAVGAIMQLASCAHDGADGAIELDDLVRVLRGLPEDLAFDHSVCRGGVLHKWSRGHSNHLTHGLHLPIGLHIPSATHPYLWQVDRSTLRPLWPFQYREILCLDAHFLSTFQDLHLPTPRLFDLRQDLGALAVEICSALEPPYFDGAARAQLHWCVVGHCRCWRRHCLLLLLMRWQLLLLSRWLRWFEAFLHPSTGKHGSESTQNTIEPGTFPSVDAASHAHNPRSVRTELDQVLRNMATPRNVPAVLGAGYAGVTHSDNCLSIGNELKQVLNHVHVDLLLCKDEVICGQVERGLKARHFVIVQIPAVHKNGFVILHQGVGLVHCDIDKVDSAVWNSIAHACCNEAIRKEGANES
mmetsp:Transcript_42175/g.97653  ORF Transcript_42175/g.97653 Transcript_42175/m.97653 type:complete len:402 (+) Transcript_42175:83-1288(+)